jgi:hypothetical protein
MGISSSHVCGEPISVDRNSPLEQASGGAPPGVLGGGDAPVAIRSALSPL